MLAWEGGVVSVSRRPLIRPAQRIRNQPSLLLLDLLLLMLLLQVPAVASDAAAVSAAALPSKVVLLVVLYCHLQTVLCPSELYYVPLRRLGSGGGAIADAAVPFETPGFCHRLLRCRFGRWTRRLMRGGLCFS